MSPPGRPKGSYRSAQREGTPATGNPLLGSWGLVRWEITYSDDRPSTLPYGPDAIGFLLYTADGHMSACIARARRPPLSSTSVRTAPAAERLAAFESYFQYAGPYELRHDPALPTGAQVVHHAAMSLNPNFVGTRQARNVEFDAAGQLTLSASDTVPGSPLVRHHRLTWKRVAA